MLGTRGLIVGVVVAAMSISIAACRPRPVDDPAASRAKFGIDPTQGSMLKSIAANASIKVCYRFRDASVEAGREREIVGMLREMVSVWNTELVGMSDPAWPVSNVTVEVVPGKCWWWNTLQVDFWATQPSWYSSFGTTRTHFDSRGSINVASEHTLGDSLALRSTLLHEYGHVLGLADTYVTPGVNEPVGQPDSLMQSVLVSPDQSSSGGGGVSVISVGSSQADSPRPDDRAGIRAMWRYVKTGRLDCGPGYRAGKVGANVIGYLFCVPVTP